MYLWLQDSVDGAEASELLHELSDLRVNTGPVNSLKSSEVMSIWVELSRICQESAAGPKASQVHLTLPIYRIYCGRFK